MTRFVRFNAVGVLGFVVQLAALAALAALRVPIAVATALAVEAAIVHNFVWHENWTWAGTPVGSPIRRFVRFHLANGLISIGGNVVLTWLFVQAGASLLGANLAAVLICALLNFAVAHLWVFCARTWPTFHGHLQ